MTFYDWKKRFDSMSERDRKTWVLAQRAVNALGFAMQNMHSDRIVERREQESSDAMHSLFEHLCANTDSASGGVRAEAVGSQKAGV